MGGGDDEEGAGVTHAHADGLSAHTIPLEALAMPSAAAEMDVLNAGMCVHGGSPCAWRLLEMSRVSRVSRMRTDRQMADA